jgi:hypothetical protein
LPDHYERFLHYHCVALLEQVSKPRTGTYRHTVRVFTIVILTEGDKHKRDVAITDFDPRDLNGQPLGEIHHKLLFLCPKYVSANTPVQYREWLEAINDSLDGEVEESNYHNPSILEVFDLILSNLITPEDRRRMIDENAYTQYTEEKVAEAAKKARQQNAEQTARRMLEAGLEMALVSRMTGLSPEHVDALAQGQGGADDEEWNEAE